MFSAKGFNKRLKACSCSYTCTPLRSNCLHYPFQFPFLQRNLEFSFSFSFSLQTNNTDAFYLHNLLIFPKTMFTNCPRINCIFSLTTTSLFIQNQLATLGFIGKQHFIGINIGHIPSKT